MFKSRPKEWITSLYGSDKWIPENPGKLNCSNDVTLALCSGVVEFDLPQAQRTEMSAIAMYSLAYTPILIYNTQTYIHTNMLGVYGLNSDLTSQPVKQVSIKTNRYHPLGYPSLPRLLKVPLILLLAI